MSASLVGSEMCIRDSFSQAPAPIPSFSPLVKIGPVAPKSSPGARGPSSVSYTHLTLPTICSV
eukprot:7016000-Alexandrium_andersonii.AAC.1